MRVDDVYSTRTYYSTLGNVTKDYSPAILPPRAVQDLPIQDLQDESRA